MEGNLITVALIGNSEEEKNALFHGLIQNTVSKGSRQDFPVPRGTYRYCDEEYLLLNLPEMAGREHFTAQFLSSGRADILLVVCNAFCLEQGLLYLSRLLKLPAVKEEALPVVFCISYSKKADAERMIVDVDLLEDVLQIPVLPCIASSPTCLDDIKTAVSAVWKRIFSYECLDFSPKKLAAETVSFVSPPSLSPEEKFNCFCLVLFLILLLLWLILTGAQTPSLCLWRVIYWLKKRIGAIVIGLIWGSILS